MNASGFFETPRVIRAWTTLSSLISQDPGCLIPRTMQCKSADGMAIQSTPNVGTLKIAYVVNQTKLQEAEDIQKYSQLKFSRKDKQT